MANNNDNDITLGGLARMVERGFEHVDEQFAKLRGEMNERFDALESRMASLETRVERLERRVSSIEEILTEHGNELRAIRSDLAELKAARELDRERLAELEKRVARLEADATGTPQAA